MNDDFYSRFFHENRDIYDDGGDFSFGEGVIKGARRTFSRLFFALAVYLLISVALINAAAIVAYIIGEEFYLAVFDCSL